MTRVLFAVFAATLCLSIGMLMIGTLCLALYLTIVVGGWAAVSTVGVLFVGLCVFIDHMLPNIEE